MSGPAPAVPGDLPPIPGLEGHRSALSLAPLGRPLMIVVGVAAVVALVMVGWGLVRRRRGGDEHGDPATARDGIDPGRLARLVLHSGAIGAVTVWVASIGGAFNTIPPGSDTWGHLAKLQLLARDWPNVSWNASWYSGAPYFAGSYPPGYHAAVLTVGQFLRISDPRAMHVVAALSLCAMTIGVAATAWVVTRRWWTGWAAAMFALASGTVWSYPLSGAVHPRVMALGASMVALAATTALVVRRTRARWAVAVVALAVAGSAHLFVAAFGFMLVGGVAVVGRLGERFAVRVARVAAVCAPAVLLDAYFYVPMASFTGAGGQVSDAGRPAPWSVLFGNELVHDGLLRGFPPMMVVVGLVVIAALSARVLVRRWSGPRVLVPIGAASLTRTAGWRATPGSAVLARTAGVIPPPPRTLPPPVAPRPEIPGGRRPPRPVRDLHARMAWGLLIGLSIALVYSFAGHFIHWRFYVLGMHAVDLLVVPALVLPAALAILAGSLAARRSRGAEVVIAGLCIVPALVALFTLVPDLDAGRHINRRSDLAAFQADLPASVRASLGSRLASTDDAISRPLNVVDPLAQTRGYQANAVTRPDYQYLVETAMIADEATTRQALYRWWSIGTVYALPGQVGTLDDGSGVLERAPVTSTSDLVPFEVTDPLPTVWSADPPVALVVGDHDQRLRLFRLMLRAGIGPDRLMLVHGPERLDQLDPAQLDGIDQLLVFGEIGDPEDAQWAAMDAWVQAGGHLFVEGVGSQIRLPKSLTDIPEPYPDPMPIPTMTLSAAAQTWRFDVAELGGIALSGFDKPDWNGSGLWETRVPSAPKSWATPVLINRGVTVVVSGRLGEGSATWSGLNLAYHADFFENPDETAVLFHLLGVDDPEPAPVTDDGPGMTTNQHVRWVSAPGDAGVFLAMNSSPNWTATVDGAPATIRSAGPEFMWIALPDDGARHVVEVTYRMSTLEERANMVSLVSIGSLLGVLCVPRRWAPRRFWHGRRAVVGR